MVLGAGPVLDADALERRRRPAFQDAAKFVRHHATGGLDGSLDGGGGVAEVRPQVPMTQPGLGAERLFPLWL